MGQERWSPLLKQGRKVRTPQGMTQGNTLPGVTPGISITENMSVIPGMIRVKL